MSKNKDSEKDNKKTLKKKVRKFFKKENVVKIILIVATLALILGSVLPYLLI